MAADAGEARPGPTVVSRVMSVLAAFDPSHVVLSLTDISTRSGLPLSTTHRLLAELESWRAVERGVGGEYRIGRRLWQLGTLAPVQAELREVALPYMQDLFVATRENVTLAVMSGHKALYVERIHGTSSVRVVSSPGRSLPLHATGVGKALLAFAPPEVIDACLRDLTPVTTSTIVDRARMEAELANVRSRGYATSVEEMTPGVAAVAVPILDSRDRAVAALGLVTRTVRKDLDTLAPAVRVAAAAISRGLFARST